MATEQALLGAIARCCVEIVAGGWQRLTHGTPLDRPAAPSGRTGAQSPSPLLVTPPPSAPVRAQRLRGFASASDLIQMERDRM